MAMLRREREDLERLSRDRERLAKAGVDARAAELKADFEQQLAAEYSWDQNEVWKVAYLRAEEVVRQANSDIVGRV